MIYDAVVYTAILAGVYVSAKVRSSFLTALVMVLLAWTGLVALSDIVAGDGTILDVAWALLFIWLVYRVVIAVQARRRRDDDA